MNYRKGTYDLEIIREVNSCYDGLTFNNKIVLDVGANIGAFSVMASKSGAKKIFSFEPDKENFALLKRNKLPNMEIFKLAVVGNNDKTRKFYLNKGINKGAHSLYIKRGRDETKVNCIRFSKVLGKYKPQVIKIDVEGSEYELLLSLKKMPEYVKQLALELHLTKKEWRTNLSQKVLSFIKDNGFIAIKPPKIGEKNWHTIGVWRRN
jgi:FkbM family methyltransferase